MTRHADIAAPVVAAFLGCQALGDFVMDHLVAASVARALARSRLVVLYRNDRPYKDFVTLMNPWVTQKVRTPADPAAVIPIDWFDGRTAVSGRPFDAAWYAAGYHAPDVFLTPSTMSFGRIVGTPPALRIPEALEPALAAALARRGLAPDRWFVCLHVRESGYAFRKDLDAARNAEPRTYVPAIEAIVAAGGQVVRLGDPTMRPLPDRPGLIDLGRAGAGFAEQAFATARARFFLGTDSGPTQVACALKVPTATTNAMGIGVWNDGDVVLYKRIVLSNGRTMTLDEMLAASNWGMQTIYPRDDVTVEDNPPEALVAVVGHMLRTTEDCRGWRADAAQPSASATDRVDLPLPWRHVTEIAELVFWDDGPQSRTVNSGRARSASGNAI